MATCLIHIPHLFPHFLRRPFLIPCHFLLYRQSYPPPPPPPWEYDRSHSLLCCIAFARGRRETAENLCRYSQPFNRVCPQSNSLWKNDLPRSVSMYRPRTGGHPSKYWPSEKLLHLSDRLAPDTYHTPNTKKYFSLLQWKFILNPKHALNLFYSESIIYEYLTWLQTGTFTLN